MGRWGGFAGWSALIGVLLVAGCGVAGDTPPTNSIAGELSNNIGASIGNGAPLGADLTPADVAWMQPGDVIEFAGIEISREDVALTNLNKMLNVACPQPVQDWSAQPDLLDNDLAQLGYDRIENLPDWWGGAFLSSNGCLIVQRASGWETDPTAITLIDNWAEHGIGFTDVQFSERYLRDVQKRVFRTDEVAVGNSSIGIDNRATFSVCSAGLTEVNRFLAEFDDRAGVRLEIPEHCWERFVAGLGGVGDGVTPPPTADLNLAGRTFVATDASGLNVPGATEGGGIPAGESITLTFERGSLSPHTGCNFMGGDAWIENGVLTYHPGESTEMLCDDWRGAAENWLTQFLASRPSIAWEGDHLVISNNQATLKLVEQPPN